MIALTEREIISLLRFLDLYPDELHINAVVRWVEETNARRHATNS